MDKETELPAVSVAAFDYVIDRTPDQRSSCGGALYFGYALREAFEAGAKWQQEQQAQEDKRNQATPTDKAVP